MATATRSARAAYDAGRAGDRLPGWVLERRDWMDRYEDGVSDRDAAGGLDLPTEPTEPAPAEDATATAPPRRTASTDTGASTTSSSTRRPGKANRGPRRRSTRVRLLPASVSRSVGSAGDTIGGFVLGLVVYSAVVNYIVWGPAAAKQWWRAKFLNEAIDQGQVEDANAQALAHTITSVTGSILQGKPIPGETTPPPPSNPPNRKPGLGDLYGPLTNPGGTALQQRLNQLGAAQ